MPRTHEGQSTPEEKKPPLPIQEDLFGAEQKTPKGPKKTPDALREKIIRESREWARMLGKNKQSPDWKKKLDEYLGKDS